LRGVVASERVVVFGDHIECMIHFAAVVIDGPAEAEGMAKQGSSAPLDRRIVGGGASVVDEGMFAEESEAESGEGMIDEVDDDELGSQKESTELGDGHDRFFAVGVLGLGACAKTSR
jgi:hypothetical protein